jgi:hypothetical protein
MTTDIDLLLEKYWNSDTSPEEEGVLKSYFSSKDVSEHHVPFKDYFESLHLHSALIHTSPSDIYTIMDKYWEGTASEYEERFIIHYFNHGEVEEDLQPFKDLFIFFQSSGELAPNQEFDVENIIEKYWNGDTSLEEEDFLRVYFQSQKDSHENELYGDYFMFVNNNRKARWSQENASQRTLILPSKGEALVLRKWAYAAAAIFVLAITSWFVIQNITGAEDSTPSYVHEIEDPEEAYKVTMEALAMLSSKYNKSEETFRENISLMGKADIFR